MPTTYPSPAAIATPTVGNAASVQVATPNLQRAGLYVFNPSAANTLWVSPTGTVAAVGGVGSIAIQPLQGQMFGWPTMATWTNGMNAIFSAGSSQICLLEFYT